MAITVKSDFWGDAYSFIRSKSPLRKVVARLLDQRELRADRALMYALTGDEPGVLDALATNKRVAHSQVELGGVRTVETEVLIDRASTGEDKTDITTAFLSYDSRDNAYPVDKATLP